MITGQTTGIPRSESFETNNNYKEMNGAKLQSVHKMNDW